MCLRRFYVMSLNEPNEDVISANENESEGN